MLTVSVGGLSPLPPAGYGPDAMGARLHNNGLAARGLSPMGAGLVLQLLRPTVIQNSSTIEPRTEQLSRCVSCTRRPKYAIGSSSSNANRPSRPLPVCSACIRNFRNWTRGGRKLYT